MCSYLLLSSLAQPVHQQISQDTPQVAYISHRQFGTGHHWHRLVHQVDLSLRQLRIDDVFHS